MKLSKPLMDLHRPVTLQIRVRPASIVIFLLGLLASSLFTWIVLSLSRPQQSSENHWQEWASTAWKYFDPGTGTDPNTGLHYARSDWHRLTDWDLAAYIQAILSAEKLGILRREGWWGSNNRIEKVLRFLEVRPVTDSNLAYQQYDAETGRVPEDMKESAVLPSSWGRLLLALEDLGHARPDLKKRINSIVARHNSKILSQSTYFGSSDIYAFYVAQGYWSFGHPTPRLKDLTRLGDESTINVYGLSLPRARITSEPLLLAILEDRTNQVYRTYADRAYEAQKRRYGQAGILTAYGEGAYPNPPYYAYEWIVTAEGEQWVVQAGEKVGETEILYAKIAFTMHAIYSDGYTKKLVEKVTGLASDQGFYEGTVPDGSALLVLSDKTNSMILEAAAYALSKTSGQPLRENAMAKVFPRYAVTTFVVSSIHAKREVEILRSVGAYNITLVYRGGPTISAEREEILNIYQNFKEFGGIMIPEFSFMQTLPIAARAEVARDRFNTFKSIIGTYPLGIFSFQLDTFTLNYLTDNHGINFAIGNLWDTTNIDFVSLRGAPPLPYYASRRNSLVPARTVEDASTLVIQPFVISLANTYHYDNNHLIDLLANGGDLEEFKYLSLNHPFFSPFMLELDWLLDLKEEHMIEAFIESYSWVFKNFNVVTASTFAEYFGVHFPTTPEFHFSFKASSSPSFPHTAHLVIEWLANSDTRIARVGKHVVSALRYKRQPNDPFLTSNKTIDFDGPRFGENPANTINMDLVFDVDSLWQYEHGNRTLKRTVTLTYDGDLGDFYSPEASRQAEHSTRLGQDFIQGITQSRSHLPPLDCFCLKADIDRAGPKWKQRVHD